MSTDPKLIEAVARAYAKIADGAVYDAMPPESREMYAKRVMPIITAYEAARGDGAGKFVAAKALAELETHRELLDDEQRRYLAMIAAAKG